MKTLTTKDLSKIIGFEENQYANIKNKLLRDALNSKGNNKLNPYKNRCRRWSWPVIILKDEKPPEGWRDAKLRINKSDGKHYFNTLSTGWGCFIKYDDWLVAVKETARNEDVKKDVGRFKIGIPYEEAATENNCTLVALTLAYQAHRILGRNDEEIKKKYPDLYKLTEGYAEIKKPICPFCKNRLNPKGFVDVAEDTSDVFYKRKEAEDNAIQMFHIECLKPAQFLHKPGNVSWGHRRCNVAMGQHDVSEAEKWFVSVLSKRGFMVKRDGKKEEELV